MIRKRGPQQFWIDSAGDFGSILRAIFGSIEIGGRDRYGGQFRSIVFDFRIDRKKFCGSIEIVVFLAETGFSDRFGSIHCAVPIDRPGGISIDPFAI